MGTFRLFTVATIVALFAATAGAATLTVGGTGDTVAADGTLTLREALASLRQGLDVNADANAARSGAYGVADQVSFAIGSGVRTIAVQAPLPIVGQPVHIDGTTQPGAEPLPRIVVSGAGAGAAVAGFVLAPGSELRGIDVAAFGGDGVVVLPLLFGDAFEAGTPAVVAPDAPVVLLDLVVRDNGGDGVRIEESTQVMLDDSRIAQNGARGLVVRGGLASESATIEDNLGHGIEVDSSARVHFDACSVTGNGSAALGAGVRLLRASAPDTRDVLDRLVRGGARLTACTVSGNAGDGVAIGHAEAQTGIVRGFVESSTIDTNATGIRVAERDATSFPTFSLIAFNDVRDNRDAGVRLTSSHQMPNITDPMFTMDVAPFIGNSIHHNAVASPGCSGPQSASQIVVDGPIVAEPALVAACGDPTIDTPAECAALADPEQAVSGGVGNACVWSGTQCVPAWDLAGPAGTGDCGTGDNRLFAYVNDPIAPQATQKGLAALNGAVVSARRNTWGIGGADNGVFADGASQVDFEEACGTFSTCP